MEDNNVVEDNKVIEDNKVVEDTVKETKKIGFFGRLIISIVDQTLIAFFATVIFFIVKFILKPLGYEITDSLGIYFFGYVASCVLYYTITKTVLKRTIGEKIFNI